MLSMTDTDARISLATPDDVKAVTTQAMNIWAGALSPLWLPFWAASTAGIGLWSLGQTLKRGFADLPAAADTALAAKWPGFTPALPAAAKVVEDVITEAPKAAVKNTKKAVETIAEVVEDAPEVLVEAAAAVTEPVAAVTAKVVGETADTVEAVTTTATEALIDPVAEVPVIPEVVEDAAETDLFKPLSAKVAPRRGKKR